MNHLVRRISYKVYRVHKAKVYWLKTGLNQDIQILIERF